MGYDPLAVIGFSTSILAIVSCIFTVITLSREWRRRTDFARDVINVHRREIGVLGHILDDCRRIITASVNVPESIYEALQMCEQRQFDLQKLMSLPVLNPNNKSTWLSINLRLPLLQKDLKRRYEMFKDDIILLRTLCSELRAQQQRFELTSDIARFMASYVIPPRHSTPPTPTTICTPDDVTEMEPLPPPKHRDVNVEIV
ncbi:hypothetical protein OQA88_10902 [Cercophora sp. LCS_1]